MIHAYAPQAVAIVKYMACRRCSVRGRRRRWIVELYAWHDPVWTCTHCGESNFRRWPGDTSVRQRERDKARVAKLPTVPKAVAIQAREQEYGG